MSNYTKGMNLLPNADFAQYKSIGKTTLNPDCYPKKWAACRTSDKGFESTYQAYTNTEKFGYPVICFDGTGSTNNNQSIYTSPRCFREDHSAENTDVFLFGLNETEYTLSLDVYAEGQNTTLSGGFYYAKAGATAGAWNSGKFSVSSDQISVGEWSRISVKVPFNGDLAEGAFDYSFYIYGNAYKGHTRLYIKNVMLELGTEPSPFVLNIDDRTDGSSNRIISAGAVDLIRVDDGKGGTGGPTLEGITRQYVLTGSATEEPAADAVWLDTMPEFNSSQYLWFRDKLTYSNPDSVSYTTVLLDENWKAAIGNYNGLMEMIGNAQKEISAVMDTNQKFSSTVTETYISNDELKQKLEEVRSELEQLPSQLQINFTTLQKRVSDLQAGTDEFITESQSHIIFDDKGITLGRQNSNFQCQITDTQISFLQGGMPVAYISNSKLYMITGHFSKSLEIGNFAFTVNDDGSLDFG